MLIQPPEAPRDSVEAQAYYDTRYEGDYAEGWDDERYQRIGALVRSLQLPATGRALDFGCGRGALTRVLQQALPGWAVVGADLSDVALNEAARKSPDLTFRHVSQLAAEPSHYDFVFSHHVLEHVLNLDDTLRLFAAIVGAHGSMLHVLPCANRGSFEHRLARLRSDGIDLAREGRFYCDDAPHVRRLSSGQLTEALARHGFGLEKAWFGDQNWGARRAYSQKSLKELLGLTSPSMAANRRAVAGLLVHRATVLLTAIACKPTYYRWRVAHAHRSGGRWTPRQVVGVACAAPLSVISTPVVRALASLARREWETRASDPRGQEMYLHFRRAKSPDDVFG